MRIIKNIRGIQHDAITIAGEMFNIEASAFAYMNGKKLEDVKKGYPRVSIGTVERIIRSHEGYIFVSLGTNLDIFEAEVNGALAELERREPATHLKTYHTLRMSYHTNIKVNSALSVTASYGGRRNNVKRQFARISNVGDQRKARFTWYIVTIDQFEFSITDAHIEDAVSRYVCSIFYDSDDICKLGHNSTTTQFSLELLKGYANITHKKIMLTSYGDPLAFELNPYWRDHSVDIAKNSLRNIPRAKVYEAQYGTFKLKPVKLSDDGTDENPVTSTEVCSKCRSLLYGDNYVLYGNIKNPDAEVGVAICPLCLHTSPEDKPIEMKYFRVFRVRFPRTAQSIIDQESDVTLKEVYAETAKGVHKCMLIEGGRQVEYVEIGDKWVGFETEKDYLFTRFSTNDKRRVILLKNLNLIR